MARVDTNTLGDRGEAIFIVAVTAFHNQKPLFRPVYLGAKWSIQHLLRCGYLNCACAVIHGRAVSADHSEQAHLPIPGEAGILG